AEDPKYVAEVVLNILKKRGPFLFSTVFYGPHVGPDLVNWRSGNCRESSDLFLYVCRALGIPCGREVMLMRGSQNVGHEWNFVPDKNGNSYFGSVTYSSNVLEEASTYWNPKGKVYRESFSLNQQMAQPFKEVTDKLYPVFRQPLFTDVTRFYTGKLNHRIEVPADKLYKTVPEGTPVYLCLSSWMDWKPVAITKFTNKKALFQDVEGGIAFRLATYENDELVLISDPLFLEKETGALRYIVGLDEDTDIVLTHKFRLEWPLADRMLGGVFEGSNKADFSEKDTLFLIKKKPVRLWSVVPVKPEKSYRYVRYRGPKDSRCNVSEVAFYEEGESDVLKGEIIGAQNSEVLEKSHNYTNVYHGDPNTSFDYYLADGGWAGLDLGMPKKISKIVYTPRNRVNFIYPGNYYELFYERHGEWISAGETEAVSDSISFKVPKGALLYLKNHSGGKDERIFEYINGEAKFW
ncbi:MAG TPA: hypothetical protein VL943_07115, partial [Niabella sp.]|nr:hypothetical protein [Niabella sp.]